MTRMAMSAHFDHIRGEEGEGGEPAAVEDTKMLGLFGFYIRWLLPPLAWSPRSASLCATQLIKNPPFRLIFEVSYALPEGGNRSRPPLLSLCLKVKPKICLNRNQKATQYEPPSGR